MKRDFSLLKNGQFDLLICGGGIYGAWTAYDAALRGLSVAIVEQNDWASATSSASSKLIHGGLRYLESYDFKLVRKALRERRLLLKNAPHRIWPLRFGVPVYANSRVGSLRLKAGLSLYDFLAGSLSADFSHQHFKRDAFAERFPSLATSDLKSGFTYSDAQTDDARLVLELIAGAMAAGAVCVNYCKLTGLLEENGRVCGATVQDQCSGSTEKIQARQIVNTSGQWVAELPEGRSWCRLTKGVHLVMPAVLTEEALLLTAQSDGRVFFLIPWYGRTLLGTTDRDYSGNLDHVTVEPEDVVYLLTAASQYLNTAWTEKDIIGSYAGLRVMKRSDHASPSAASRDWELKTAANGMHYSIGGKITSAREDAACIVNTICTQLNIDAPCPTEEKIFPWAPTENYSTWSADANEQANRLGIDPESAKWLIRRHGKRVQEIFLNIENDRSLAERVVSTLPFIRADLLWSVANEMIVHLDDLLRRRMPLLILAKLTESDLRWLATIVAPVMGWNETAKATEIAACRSGPCPR